MRPIVAIDGPAGSGKSTVARAVAARLGVPVLDTGAMYRAVTVAVLRAGVDPDDADAVARVAGAVALTVDERVHLDGADVTDEIRGTAATAAVSAVSAVPGVRRILVERQRAWVLEHGGGVVEGRDIGTVVLPDAAVKVFLTAPPEVRAERRRGDELAARRAAAVDAVLADLERRDQLDSTRVVSPLQPADDAVIIDTAGLSVEDVVDQVVSMVEQAGEASR